MEDILRIHIIHSKFPVCSRFERLISLFVSEVDREVEAAINALNMIKWERNLLRSLFTEDCIEKGRDIIRRRGYIQ